MHHPEVGRAREIGVFQQRLDLGPKSKAIPPTPIVKRFHPEPVSRAEQSRPICIPNGEGKHAVEPVEAVDAPFPIGLQHHFGIGHRTEDIAPLLKVFSQFEIVVYFSIVRNPNFPVFARHRLMAEGRTVQDRKAAMAKSHRITGRGRAQRSREPAGDRNRLSLVTRRKEDIPFPVRPPVRKHPGHRSAMTSTIGNCAPSNWRSTGRPVRL